MILTQALLIGIVAGLRTFVAPAAVMFVLRLPAAWIAAALGLVEMYGDKSPLAPDRTTRPALFARLLFGAGSAFALALWGNGRLPTATNVVWEAAALGLIGALGGAYGGLYVRRALTRPDMFPSLAVALAEDALAIGLAYFAVTL